MNQLTIRNGEIYGYLGPLAVKLYQAQTLALAIDQLAANAAAFSDRHPSWTPHNVLAKAQEVTGEHYDSLKAAKYGLHEWTRAAWHKCEKKYI